MNRCNLKQDKTLKTTDDGIIKQAIALHYDESRSRPVPQVTATGQNEIAEQILELARQHNIPVHEDADMTVLQSQLDLYEDIPETLYQACG